MSDVLLPPLPNFREWPYTHEELRARDLEVARVVLESCIRCIDWSDDMLMKDFHIERIRALEFKHAE